MGKYANPNSLYVRQKECIKQAHHLSIFLSFKITATFIVNITIRMH